MTPEERRECLWLPCPFCGSTPGHPCFQIQARTIPQKPAPRPHMARVSAYRSKQKETS